MKKEDPMFKIGKLFHLTHVVNDLGAVDNWYDDVFSCKRFYKGYEKLAGRDASLLVIGEVLMEPMTPSKRENLRNLSVKKFHDRFGQHFHSIAWYVDDVEEISPHKMDAIWTHPRETPGQLEFALNGDFAKDPRFEPDWSNKPWRDHPLGIEGASHIGVVVGDMSKAKKLYVDVLETGN
jgi:hypothetical protein